MTNCIEKTTKDGEFRAEERSKIIFVNEKNEKLTIIKIDGCFVTGNANKRCDFMVQHGVINYYIELKVNRYIREAVVQIAKSINTLNEKHFDGKRCKAIIVVANQVPRRKVLMRARGVLKERLESEVHCPLKIQNSPYDLPLS